MINEEVDLGRKLNLGLSELFLMIVASKIWVFRDLNILGGMGGKAELVFVSG